MKIYTKQKLITKLKKIAHKGWIPNARHGNHGGIGNTLEDLLGIEGVGPKTVRALSLISELVYGVPASFRDPARYSFAHGGKDGHPFPVDRQIYDKSIELLARAVNKARLDGTEKREALSRLNKGFRRGATG